MELIKGIDVSENNGFVDWQAVADAGIKFAIVRSSYGRNSRDENFLQNVAGAHEVGLKCGAYHYSYALTPRDAYREAQNCKKAIDEAKEKLIDSARIVVRPSGTEPKIRVMVECFDEDLMNEIANDVAAVIKKELGEL
jgi:GH25 family lysozyme M1 (1,4-beta-N-acetylmuramidase)